MGKGTNFSGQPIFTQLLNLLDKSKISKASKALGADRYVKRFTSHKHIVVMLFVAFEGCLFHPKSIPVFQSKSIPF